MRDKTLTLDQIPDHIESGMTIGIGGWGSRRKPMSMVRSLLNSDVTDLTVVTFGGPDAGLLCAAGKVKKLVYGFVSLDSIPLDPLFTGLRERGAINVDEYDEGMFVAGLRAAAQRLSFLPIRAGIGSDVPAMNPHLKTIASPYDDDVYLAMPALKLDVTLIHVNRSDAQGNAQYLGPDPYFDDLFAMAADTCLLSTERIVPTGELLAEAPPQSLLLSRMYVDKVVEAPNGAHFTSCTPDYERDEAFQRHYAKSARDPEAWQTFTDTFLRGDESSYHEAVRAFHESAAREGASS